MGSRLTVEPAVAPLRGTQQVPGDKSISHRALLLSALAEGTSRLWGLGSGQDNLRTLTALAALGVHGRRTAEGAVEVSGRGLYGLRPPGMTIDCGNSATTLRLLAGVLAAQPFSSEIDGDRYLRARPMRRVVEPLRRMGAVLSGQAGLPPGEVYAPLRIHPAASLRGILHQSPVASAQVKSALLLCGLWAEGPTEVREPARSRDHTERLLRRLGVPLSVSDTADAAVCRLDPTGWRRALPPLHMQIPGDMSSAAFLMGAALLVSGSEVVLRGVGTNPTRTGVLDAMAQLAPGAVEILDEHEEAGEPVSDLRVRSPGGPLRPMRIEGQLALRAIDELPLLASLAGAAEGETLITGAVELRVKESDRLAASCALLRAFGVECEELPDGLRVHGRGPAGLRGAVVSSFGDHRIAMAAAVLALAAPTTTRIEEAESIETSFPGFAHALAALGAPIGS
ncbi:MAG: 3-phosphoshikimate 1-carboxyvinyltransferase [Myxococcota bacterium]|nr:3-phosphoshikimate 1-carboxyvinyltransferase [Myxococcota bacterium]